MPGFDLHTHTTFSDGTTTPEHNVELALEAGLEGLAVTDHDTTAPWDRARAAADATGLEIIPGAEMSAELDGYSVHVLGYWFDPDDPDLSEEMQRLFYERDRRAEEIVARFRDGIGIPITMDQVRGHAGGAPVGRPHIATAVVELGEAETVTEVFDRWLHDGGPAYVPKYAVDPPRCVQLITGAGGAAVLAHPGLFGTPEEPGMSEETISGMVDAGLVGIEGHHPDHDPQMRDRYLAVARQHDLVVTAGSDFHGDRKALDLGQATTSRERVEELFARRGRST